MKNTMASTSPKTEARQFLDQLQEIVNIAKKGHIVADVSTNILAQLAIVRGRLEGIESGAITTGQADILNSLVAAMSHITRSGVDTNGKVEIADKTLLLIEKLSASTLTIEQPLRSMAASAHVQRLDTEKRR